MFGPARPAARYEQTLQIIELGERLGYDRLLRLRSFLRGDAVTDFEGREGIEKYSSCIEPHSPGLAECVGYGAASVKSARGAGENGTPDLASNQGAQIRDFWARHPDRVAARVSQGLVVIPTDSAT